MSLFKLSDDLKALVIAKIKLLHVPGLRHHSRSISPMEFTSNPNIIDFKSRPCFLLQILAAFS